MNMDNIMQNNYTDMMEDSTDSEDIKDIDMLENNTDNDDVKNINVMELEDKYVPLMVPLDIDETSNGTSSKTVNQKTKNRYESIYKSFKDWCVLNDLKDTISENVLLDYFKELSSKNKKSSSLLAIYSMLTATLKHEENIDISKYSNLSLFLKNQKIGYKPKKSSTFSQNEIDTFLSETSIELLPYKVALIIGISGACKSDELFKIKYKDLTFLEDKIIITITSSKTYLPRVFVIVNKDWIKLIKQYTNLRDNIDHEKFFMQIRNAKLIKQPIGQNSISSMPRKIAAYLKLKDPNSYTGHCFKKTGLMLRTNRKNNISQLTTLSDNTFNGESIQYSINAKDKTVSISSNVNNSSTSNSSNVKNIKILEEKHGICININSSGDPNVTININFNKTDGK